MMSGRIGSNQDQAPGNYNHDDIYLKTPVGQALEEAMEQMGLSEEQQQNIVEKFRKSILQEFSALKDYQYGVSGGSGSAVNYSQEPQDKMHNMSRDHERKASHSFRNKLESKCKSYKCMFFTWQF